MKLKKREKHLTIMLVPDDNSKVVSIRLSGIIFAGLLLLWVSGIAVSAFIISRHANYRATIEYNKYLNQKHKVFTAEVLRAREAVKRISELDGQLRGMLKLKSREGIIKYTGFGGPTNIDSQMLEKHIKDRDSSIETDSFALAAKYIDEESRKSEQSYQQIIKYITEQRARMTAVPSGWPVKGWITAGFGSRMDPFTGALTFHEGVDIANDEGTPIKAQADGVIVGAGFERGYGNVVLINHANGYTTRFGHMRNFVVTKGQHIKKGQILGYMGSTGRSTASHLHYEVRLNGVAVNPVRYMREETALNK
jgi:murein DD-endopeptidase MepM/ murein hydrolase activator NlpD